jgi:hypothetical protein
VSTGYKIAGDGLLYLTIQIVGWVEVFTRKIYRDIIIESLKYCQKHKGWKLSDWITNGIPYLKQAKAWVYIFDLGTA